MGKVKELLLNDYETNWASSAEGIVPKEYSEEEIENALQILDYYKGCAGGDAKPSIEKSIEIARHCILKRKSPRWINAQEALPEKQGYGNLVKCNVILVRYQTIWDFNYPPETCQKEIVYSALFDTEQKIWHILEEHMYLNALVNPDDIDGDFDCVGFWMYAPSLE